MTAEHGGISPEQVGRLNKKIKDASYPPLFRGFRRREKPERREDVYPQISQEVAEAMGLEPAESTYFREGFQTSIEKGDKMRGERHLKPHEVSHIMIMGMSGQDEADPEIAKFARAEVVQARVFTPQERNDGIPETDFYPPSLEGWLLLSYRIGEDAGRLFYSGNVEVDLIVNTVREFSEIIGIARGGVRPEVRELVNANTLLGRVLKRGSAADKPRQ